MSTKMNGYPRDASTSPTAPSPSPLTGVDPQFYCAVTCCQDNSCEPSTILKGVKNPYYCPYREIAANGQLENSCTFSDTGLIPNGYALDPDMFYTSGHGFFRRAVPTMPLCLALMLFVVNLLLPGLGTLVASLTILFGCDTEYGAKHWCKAFLICFVSSALQIVTAIFVFGWVWSIMWGIVFIKNSLRYGNKHDLYTISLC